MLHPVLLIVLCIAQITADSWCWVKLPKMPYFRSRFVMQVYDNKIYLFGGKGHHVHLEPHVKFRAQHNVWERNLDIYDLTSQTWAAEPPNLLDDMRFVPRESWTGNAIGNDALILIGGADGLNSTSWTVDTCVFSDKQLPKCERRRPLRNKVNDHGSAVANGAVYVFGGRSQRDHFRVQQAGVYAKLNSKFLGWNPIKPTMPTPRAGFGIATVDNRYIYLLGGYTDTDTLASVDVFDTHTKAWSTAPNIPLPPGFQGISHMSTAVVTTGDEPIIILAGGSLESTDGKKELTDRVVFFSPHHNKWNIFENNPAPTKRVVAGTLAYKNVMIVMGGEQLDDKKDVKLLDDVEMFGLRSSLRDLLNVDEVECYQPPTATATPTGTPTSTPTPTPTLTPTSLPIPLPDHKDPPTPTTLVPPPQPVVALQAKCQRLGSKYRCQHVTGCEWRYHQQECVDPHYTATESTPPAMGKPPSEHFAWADMVLQACPTFDQSVCEIAPACHWDDGTNTCKAHVRGPSSTPTLANMFVCQGGHCTKGGKMALPWLGIILGISIGVNCMLLLGGVLLWRWAPWKRKGVKHSRVPKDETDTESFDGLSDGSVGM